MSGKVALDPYVDPYVEQWTQYWGVQAHTLPATAPRAEFLHWMTKERHQLAGFCVRPDVVVDLPCWARCAVCLIVFTRLAVGRQLATEMLDTPPVEAFVLLPLCPAHLHEMGIIRSGGTFRREQPASGEGSPLCK